jgi:cellulose synthase/poly-beta-1,6-N-acetylglucosamine synthase-like glycosyltransferase
VLAFVFFAGVIGLRIYAAITSVRLSRLRPAAPITRTLEYPIYSILCPLHREAACVPALVGALSTLDYPRDKLDILLVLEADDAETLAAVRDCNLGPEFGVIIAPAGKPKTKPKALNVALPHAKGEFLAIYDAKDVPHPAQLKAAIAAFDGDARLACVQAPLLIDNAPAGWLPSQFALEYAIQFLEVVPALARLRLPLPLGGTSNHFPTRVVRNVGG